jgi:serine/threonine protein phosphatase PrpC
MVAQTAYAALSGREALPPFCAPVQKEEPPRLTRRITYVSSQEPQEAQHPGSRPYQEDRLLKPVELSFKVKGQEVKAALFGIFDGHGEEGRCADLVKERLPAYLPDRLTEQFERGVSEEGAVGNAFTQVCAELAQEYGKREHRHERIVEGRRMVSSGGGTTVCCGFRLGKRVYFVNVGDSRAILVKGDKYIQLTEDASLNNPRFRRWHDKNHNIIGIADDGALRVWNEADPYRLKMGLARAVGSNKWMCSRPKISYVTLGDGEDALARGRLFADHRDGFLFVSDGVTGRLSSKQIRERFLANRRQGLTDQQNIDEIAATAGLPPGSDNSSLLFVAIPASWMPR